MNILQITVPSYCYLFNVDTIDKNCIISLLGTQLGKKECPENMPQTVLAGNNFRVALGLFLLLISILILLYF